MTQKRFLQSYTDFVHHVCGEAMCFSILPFFKTNAEASLNYMKLFFFQLLPAFSRRKMLKDAERKRNGILFVSTNNKHVKDCQGWVSFTYLSIFTILLNRVQDSEIKEQGGT